MNLEMNAVQFERSSLEMLVRHARVAAHVVGVPRAAPLHPFSTRADTSSFVANDPGMTRLKVSAKRLEPLAAQSVGATGARKPLRPFSPRDHKNVSTKQPLEHNLFSAEQLLEVQP